MCVGCAEIELFSAQARFSLESLHRSFFYVARDDQSVGSYHYYELFLNSQSDGFDVQIVMHTGCWSPVTIAVTSKRQGAETALVGSILGCIYRGG
jgi:hypothetical protein